MSTQRSVLTIVQQVYHQQINKQPTVIESRFQVNLVSDEQPYIRYFNLGPGVIEVDLGWLHGVPLAAILVQNQEGRPDKNPTEEEAAAYLANHSISVSFRRQNQKPDTGIAFILPPGESLRVRPMEGFRLVLAKQSANSLPVTRVIVAAFPA